jgi:hypothetical protein
LAALRCAAAHERAAPHAWVLSSSVVIVRLRFLPVLVVVVATAVIKGRVGAATTTSVGLLLAHAIAISSVIGATATTASTHYATWATASHHVIGCASTELKTK